MRALLVMWSCVAGACNAPTGISGPFRCADDADCVWGFVCDSRQEPPLCVRPSELSNDASSARDRGPTESGAADGGVVDRGLTDSGTADTRPAVFVSGEDCPDLLAVDETHLFWTTDAYWVDPEIRRVPKSGGEPDTIAFFWQGGRPRAIAVDESFVYVYVDHPSANSDLVGKVSKTGVFLPVTRLASGQEFWPGSNRGLDNIMFATETALYWLSYPDGSSNRLVRHSLGAAADSYKYAEISPLPVVGLKRFGERAYMAVADSGLVSIDLNFSPGVTTCRNDLDSSESFSWSAASNGTYLFWTTLPAVSGATCTTYALSSSGEADSFMPHPRPVLAMVAGDRDLFYWLDCALGGGCRGLYQKSIDTLAPATLQVPASAYQPSLALDDTHVYWSDCVTGEIWRVERPGSSSRSD